MGTKRVRLTILLLTHISSPVTVINVALRCTDYIFSSFFYKHFLMKNIYYFFVTFAIY